MSITADPIKLAIADDHQLFREGIRLIFEAQSSINVMIEANNGRELLHALEQDMADVVLLDLEMPELNGAETLKVIREKYPDLKVLLLTMHDNEKYMVSFLQLGANGYLLKDTAPEELVFAVKRVHETGKYLSDRVSDALLNRLGSLKTKAPQLGDITNLGERELEVLQLICQEHTTAEIADQLFLSTRTIETYRKRLLEKTDTRNTAGLVRFAIEKGLLKE